MKETLHIKNFGPIKDVKLELGKVNVLIGDQGTGKSTVAKLLAAIRNTIFFELFNLKVIDESKIQTEKFREYLKLFDLLSFLKTETEIILAHSEFNFLYKNGIVIADNQSDNISNALIYGDFNYIPTERILISTLSDLLFALVEIKAEIPRLILRFGDKYSKGKKLDKKYYKNILGVDFVYSNGTDSIIINDDFVIPLSNGSSGIQGTVPLLVVFDMVTNEMNFRTGINEVGPLLVIEEPELNLFPETQKKLLFYLIHKNFGYETNLNKKNVQKYYLNQLLFTTHSPYILTSLNNLMYAYTVGQKHKEKVSEIIPEKYWLNPTDVSAYMLVYDEKEGGCIAKNILDEDDGLIDSVQIDVVSDILSEEFNNIMAIKLGV